ncbi:OsmC family protein [Brevibacterium yomogidense]|uniref:OsmC family protein n=1 Tax=Brevibacterium yomogidense TaxID=946573 RepID=UPI0018DFDD8E|nr:OsmC family protein [Brevibacterium yomogidense]
MNREKTDGRALYTATAHNHTGPDGESWADGGLRIAVRSPLAPARSSPPPARSPLDPAQPPLLPAQPPLAPTQPPLTPAHTTGDADAGDGPPADSPETNPEELLALAWATCLSASARIVAGDERKVSVRVEVELREDTTGPGYAFAPTAYIAFSDTTPGEADALAAAAHARCPMSKLLTGKGTANIVAVPYPPA